MKNIDRTGHFFLKEGTLKGEMHIIVDKPSLKQYTEIQTIAFFQQTWLNIICHWRTFQNRPNLVIVFATIALWEK